LTGGSLPKGVHSEYDGQCMAEISLEKGAQPSFWHRWGRLILGVLVSVGVIFWLGRTLDLRQILIALRDVNYAWVVVGLLMVLLTLWARVLRWHALLDSRQVTASGALPPLVLGQLLNLIAPARLGDLGRAYLVTRQGYPSQARALGTVALEKLWDIALLVGLVFGLSFWQPLPIWLMVPTRLTAIGGGVLLGGVLALLLARRHLVARESYPGVWSETAIWRFPGVLSWLAGVVGRLVDGLTALQRPRVMLAAGGWSVLAWLFGALANLALFKAFGLPLSMGMALILLAVLQLGVAVPSVPGRIGVFEGLCLVTLALFGVETNLALGYGIVLHAVVLLPPVALGLWWLLRLDAGSRRAVWKLT
jgi:uncharacterized membrane protein YbhN (UPF0104 family)